MWRSEFSFPAQKFQQDYLYCDNDEQLASLTNSQQQKTVKITDLRGLDCIYVQRFPPKIGYFYNEQTAITSAEASALSQTAK